MARKTGSINHTHMYFRRPDGLWACAGLEDCTHFMPKNMAPAPAGRMSICWSCKKKFQLAPYNMEEDKPMCDDCTERMRIINEYNEEQGVFEPLTGLAAFGAKTTPVESAKTMQDFTPKLPVTKTEERDEIEVIDDEGGHAPDCGIYDNLDCTCK